MFFSSDKESRKFLKRKLNNEKSVIQNGKITNKNVRLNTNFFKLSYEI